MTILLCACTALLLCPGIMPKPTDGTIAIILLHTGFAASALAGKRYGELPIPSLKNQNAV